MRLTRPGALAEASAPPPLTTSLRSGAGGLRRGGARGGGRRVVELLLGAEQQVEDLVPKVRAHRQRDRAADDADHKQTTEAALALLLLGALTEGVAGITQRVRRMLKILVELLVVEQRLRR